MPELLNQTDASIFTEKQNLKSSRGYYSPEI